MSLRMVMKGPEARALKHLRGQAATTHETLSSSDFTWFVLVQWELGGVWQINKYPFQVASRKAVCDRHLPQAFRKNGKEPQAQPAPVKPRLLPWFGNSEWMLPIGSFNPCLPRMGIYSAATLSWVLWWRREQAEERIVPAPQQLMD